VTFRHPLTPRGVFLSPCRFAQFLAQFEVILMDARHYAEQELAPGPPRWQRHRPPLAAAVSTDLHLGVDLPLRASSSGFQRLTCIAAGQSAAGGEQGAAGRAGSAGSGGWPSAQTCESRLRRPGEAARTGRSRNARLHFIASPSGQTRARGACFCGSKFFFFGPTIHSVGQRRPAERPVSASPARRPRPRLFLQ